MPGIDLQGADFSDSRDPNRVPRIALKKTLVKRTFILKQWIWNFFAHLLLDNPLCTDVYECFTCLWFVDVDFSLARCRIARVQDC